MHVSEAEDDDGGGDGGRDAPTRILRAGRRGQGRGGEGGNDCNGNVYSMNACH